jgi:hypothetical protein
MHLACCSSRCAAKLSADDRRRRREAPAVVWLCQCGQPRDDLRYRKCSACRTAAKERVAVLRARTREELREIARTAKSRGMR